MGIGKCGEFKLILYHNGSMFEPVAVVVCFLPSSLFVLLVLLLDFIGTNYRENYVASSVLLVQDKSFAFAAAV